MKMEGNGLTTRTRMYTNTNIGRGMLPLQAQNPQKLPHFMDFVQKQQQQQQKYQIDQQQTQLSIKQPNYNNPIPNPPQKPKIQLTQFSKNNDEDDPGCSNTHESGSNDLKRKNGSNVSQWQRVKWTDDMVRLLIKAVYYIGDEAGGSELEPDKKKPGCGGGCSSGGVLQKKGKWKSVSMAMMEKGFCVSPQQCEDKFNDLNKRYKRVNDILGKGIACKVVENQGLLQSMDIAPNLKEEVRKLLNSKHLFFREMCAFHNSSCGNNANSIGGGSGCKTTTTPPSQHNWNGEDSENEDDCEDDDEVEDHKDGNGRKRARTMGTDSGSGWNELNEWSGLVKGMVEDGSKSIWEKKQWVMIQMVKLEENGVKIQCQALELEKERLKWMKFSSKKEREMKKMKIDNEKRRLENERKVLMLRKKEIECVLAEKQ